MPPARYLADVCFLLHPLSESTSTFCSLPPFYLGSARVLSLFRFYTSFCPSSLYLSTLPHVLFRHIPLIYPLCFSEELECFLYARISLLNLVHQVTILLLSPFSPRYFSCRYSTLLLFLVNAFVFVTRHFPFIFLHTLGFYAFVCLYFSLPFTPSFICISPFIYPRRFYYPLVPSLLLARAIWLFFYLSRFVYCHLALNVTYYPFSIFSPANPCFISNLCRRRC